MQECKELAAALKIHDRVLFTGFIAGTEKNEALIDADIVAQMSRQEQGAWAPLRLCYAVHRSWWLVEQDQLKM